MNFGVCADFGNVENLVKIKEVGFDFFELNLSDLGNQDRAILDNLVEAKKTNGLNFKAVNCFFPANVKITGSDMNETSVREYTEKVLAVANELGVKVCVIGSQGARNLLDGYDYQKGIEEFVRAVKIAGEVAAKYGMDIAVEHLSTFEGSNFITTSTEAVNIAKLVDMDNVGIVLDIFHFHNEKEDFSVIKTLKNHIKHVHLVQPIGRGFPTGIDEYLQSFCNCLNEINYDKMISVESWTENFEDYKKALTCMRELF